MKLFLIAQQNSKQITDTVKSQDVKVHVMDPFWYFLLLLVLFGLLFWLYKCYELKKYKLKMITEFALESVNRDEKLKEIEMFANIIRGIDAKNIQ